MRDFSGKVAVVTGAASGIGLALATRFAEEGMHVVLADIEEPALEAAITSLSQKERSVIGVWTDVSKPESIDALAQKAVEAYGKVHILCNNAGVGGAGLSPWEASLRDYQWVLGVNLWGVINGIRSFVPIMLNQDEEGHVVNTASVMGLLPPASGTYSLSKHGVVVLSEWLHQSLKARRAKIGASVLCPGFVRTQILDSVRNRPDELRNETSTVARPSALATALVRGIENGQPPEEVAGLVIDAIREEQFWIRTEAEFDEAIRTRTDEILERRDPSPLTL